MDRLIGRPVLTGALALVAGTWLAAMEWFPGPLVPGLLAAAGLVGFMTHRTRPRQAAGMLAVLFVGLGALVWLARHSEPPGDPLARLAATQPASTRYELTGDVVRADLWTPDETYLSFFLEVDAVRIRGNSVDAPGRIVVRWSQPTFAVHPGDRIHVEGELAVALSRINPDTPSVEDYYRRADVHTALRAWSGRNVVRLDTAPSYAPRAALSRFRAHLARRLENAVPDDSEAFLRRVWLGERAGIDDATYRTFLESGTAHILAVSGLHTGIVFVTISGVLKPLIRRKKLRILLILVAIGGFALLTGGRISSLRAASMIALYLTADWFDREPDTPTTLGIAAALFILHRPDVLFDTAFQLSFLSIASILLFADRFASLLAFVPRKFQELLGATVAVQVLPLPVAIGSFHVFPLAAIVVNLFVIPLLGVILWLGLVTSVFALVAPPVAVLFGSALHVPVQLTRGIASLVSSADTFHTYLPSPTGIAMALYWMAAIAGWFALRAPRARILWIVTTSVLLLFSIAAWRPWLRSPEVTVLDVGHGDATFIRTPENGVIVVDAGDRTEFRDMGRHVVSAYLWANHETRIDVLAVSHPDRDHIGGVAYLIRHFPVGALLLGPEPVHTPLEEELLTLCAERNVPVIRAARGDTFELRGATIEVLHPPAGWPVATNRNDRSLTLRVSWPDFSVLLPGDVEYLGEATLTAIHPLADVLKVPHHGSDTSSTNAFIEAVAPRLAVVSVGPRGRNNVLKPSVLRRYRDQGITLYRTDVVGGVRISPRHGSIQVDTARGRREYPTRQIDF